MKKILSFLFLLIGASFVNTIYANEYVNGYTKRDGTYVNGYHRSHSNGTNHDNYSTKGNRNPYTGRKGTVAPDYSSQANKIYSNGGVRTGPRGGQYYINKNGNKTYVPKSR